MKKILYYVTDGGKGHATRSIAIIRELLNQNFEVVVRNSNSLELLKRSLPTSSIISGKTDVGITLQSNGIFIDEEKSKIQIGKWISELDNYVKMECEKISSLKANLVISDISIMPLLVANKLNVNSIAVSNFSWYDVLKFLPSDQLSKIKLAYDFADLAIQLPIGTDMEHFKNKKNLGLAARFPTKTREDLRKHFGVKDDEFVVTFALGGENPEINCTFGKNIKVFSMDTKVSDSINFTDCTQWTEGQEIVLASDLVLCKAGYGFLSECITNGIKFRYVFDENHMEQASMSDDLKKLGINGSITLEEINNSHFDTDFIRSQQEIKKQKNNVPSIAKLMLEFLKN